MCGFAGIGPGANQSKREISVISEGWLKPAPIVSGIASHPSDCVHSAHPLPTTSQGG